MLTKRTKVAKQDAATLWQTFATAMGEFELRPLAFASVNDLADKVRSLGVFDLEKFTDHAIAYELRHEALRQLVNGNGGGDERIPGA